MFVISPSDLCKKSLEFLEQTYLPMQKASCEFALAHSDNIPYPAELSAARNGICTASGILLSEAQLLDILALYPVARAKLTAFSWEDTEVQGVVLDAIADFFLSSTWPTFGDLVDHDAYFLRLRKAAKFLGHSVLVED